MMTKDEVKREYKESEGDPNDAEGGEGGERLLSRTPLPLGATLSTGPGARALIRRPDGGYPPAPASRKRMVRSIA